jgi:hypothetical protein
MEKSIRYLKAHLHKRKATLMEKEELQPAVDYLNHQTRRCLKGTTPCCAYHRPGQTAEGDQKHPPQNFAIALRAVRAEYRRNAKTDSLQTRLLLEASR